MRFLLVWPSAEFSIYDVAVGIAEGLTEEGHEIVDYRLYQRMALMVRAISPLAPEGRVPDMAEVSLLSSEGLVCKALTEGVDWVLVISGMGLHPNSLLALRRARVPVAVWFTEAPYDTDTEKELYLAQFADVAFVNERAAVGEFQRTLDRIGEGGVAAYLPHAYRPTLHRPLAPGEEPASRCDVLLIGTGFAERQALLEAVDWEGIDLRLGGMWPGILPPSHLRPHLRDGCIANEDTVQLYRGAKVVLNPHRWHPGAQSANPRSYEVAACGAFQISDYRAEVFDIFGESVPTYSPGVPWRLGAMVRRYLADDGLRLGLAEEAMRRVAPHTFRARARRMADILHARGQPGVGEPRKPALKLVGGR